MQMMRARRLIPVAVALATAAGLLTWSVQASSAASAGTSAVDVGKTAVEYEAHPLGLDVERPRFSWTLTSDSRAQAQSAYRILVAASPETLADDEGDVWDSGRVESSRSQLVEYDGPALADRTRYHWKVMAWDQDGRETDWSRPSWWETGIMDPTTLDAEWIGHEIDERLPTVNEQQNLPAELDEGATLGQSFTTDRSFDKVSAKFPTWNASDSDATLTLRRDGPNGEQLATRRIEDVGDNAWVEVSVDAHLQPGTYYLEQSEPVGTVGWWSHSDDVYAHGTAFADGAAVAGDRTIRWEPVTTEADGRTPQLRKEFALDRPIARARLYASALGVYELDINGRRVGDHRFAPGWTDYDTRVQYQTYDVTRLLDEGGNAIGATIAPGWYAGHVAIFGPDQYGTQPWLFAQLEVTYEDGTTEVIGTDDTWRSSTGPVLESDFLMGETYDAQLATPGWTRPGYDDSGWQPVVANDEVTAELVAQVDPPVRIEQEIEPVARTQPTPGVYVFDLGQNMVGSVRLTVDGPAGTTVTLRHAEVLGDDGTIYTDNLRSAKATDHYTLSGRGTEVYEPEFTFHGFRYVELTGYPGKPSLDAITGRVMHTDAPFTSDLDTSSPMLDQLYSNITWGQRGNFLSIPTDTPARDERMGWTGDINVFVGAAAYNMEVAPFLTKWLQDLRDAQFDDGAFTDVAPLVGFIGGGVAGWGDAGVTVPYTLWQQYGDERVLSEHYAALQGWIDYLVEHSNGYIRPAEGYGDWLNVEDETPKDVIATAYFAYAASLASEIATAIGEDADAAEYEQLAADVRQAFNDAYVSADGHVHGDTQTAYVLALGFDLLPDELRDPAADRLVELIEQRDWHLSTGFLGTPDLLPVLTETGHNDVAYRLLNQDTYPSWGYQIGLGSTTMWEHWDSIKPDGTFEDPAMNSFNHYAYGAVGEWMFRNIAGINSAAPGFAESVIRPRPGGGLGHARAEYDSVYGPIETSWRDTDRGFRLDVSVPVNTTAEVWVPALEPGSVTESGRPAGQVEGVTLDRMADGYAVFQVGSGDYLFASDDVVAGLLRADRATTDLRDTIDDLADAGELSDGEQAYLDWKRRWLARAIDEGTEEYVDGDDSDAVREVQNALGIVDRIAGWVAEREASGDLSTEAAARLTTAADGVREPLSAASALLLGVRTSLQSDVGSVVAGDAVEVVAKVTNTGRTRIDDVEVAIEPPAGWTVEPAGPAHVDGLRPGRTFTARFAVAAPLSQAVAKDVAVSATVGYRLAGGRAVIPLSTPIDVASPVAITDVTAQPRIIDQPGTRSTVTATIVNRSASAVTGTVRAAAPEGWPVEPGERSYDLAPGEERTVTFDVTSPNEPAAATVSLTASYGENVGDAASVRLTYALKSWLFETDGDAEQWEPANSLSDFEVTGGILHTSSPGADPYMINGETLAIDASEGLTVEVTMRTSGDSEGQVFWTTAAEPNFSEGRSTKFAVTGGELRTYSVPVPSFDGQLAGLRLDPVNSPGDIAIDSIRIVR